MSGALHGQQGRRRAARQTARVEARAGAPDRGAVRTRPRGSSSECGCPAAGVGADFGPHGFKCVSTVNPAQEVRRDAHMVVVL